jgi:hypothetical protein
VPWLLVSHGPPLERLDFVGKGSLPVGDRHLLRQLVAMALGGPRTDTTLDATLEASSVSAPPLSRRVNRAPLLHAFGHVHAQQHVEEAPAGPRFLADSRLGDN